MKVTLGSCSFAEVGHCDPVFVVDSILVASSSCLRDLSAKRRAHSADVEVFATVMNRHLATFAPVLVSAGELMGHLLDREATPKESSRLTVLREQ